MCAVVIRQSLFDELVAFAKHTQPVCMYVYTYMRMYVCMYVCMYVP
jgi:hypothetical protein